MSHEIRTTEQLKRFAHHDAHQARRWALERLIGEGDEARWRPLAEARVD